MYIKRTIIDKWTFFVDGMFYWARYSKVAMVAYGEWWRSLAPSSRRDDFFEIVIHDELGISVRAKSKPPPDPNVAELTRLLVAELQAKRKKLLGTPTIDKCCACTEALENDDEVVRMGDGDRCHAECLRLYALPD